MRRALGSMSILLVGAALGRAQLASTRPPDAGTATAREARQICQTGMEPLDSSDIAIDAMHPKYFVEVSEVSTRGTRRLIHTAVPFSGPARLVCQRINAPVDVDSKIVMRVNRSFLTNHPFGGKFAITARVEGANGGRAVEVPGYSMIGKASESVPVNLADVSGLSAAFLEVQKEVEVVRTALGAALSLATKNQDSLQRIARQRAGHVGQLADSVHGDSVNLQTAVSALTVARKAVQPDAVDTMPKRASVDQATAALEARARRLQDSIRSLAADSARLRGRALAEYLPAAQNVLSERQHTLTAIEQIAAPQNRPLLTVYARSKQLLPELLLRLATTSDSEWKAVLAQDFAVMPDGQRPKWEATVRGLEAALVDLAAAGSAAYVNSLQTLVLDAMRDAELTVRQTGADIGDVIVLTISDSAGDPAASRTLEIRLPVRQFGFVRRVTDAVLIMNVPGVHEDAAVSAAQSHADNANQGSTLNFPLNLRGSPSAGVSLLWTYLPRLDDNYAWLVYPLRATFNWLRPGVGMNASVISVAHKTITITPKQPLKETAKDPEVAYTFGLVVSGFDGAVQWSLGRTLTGDPARTYTAIGISFLSATDKAKDLFKALMK